jgi:hypothetical protein
MLQLVEVIVQEIAVYLKLLELAQTLRNILVSQYLLEFH